MFVELHPTESGLTLDGPIPPLLAPLLDAGRRGLALEAPV